MSHVLKMWEAHVITLNTFETRFQNFLLNNSHLNLHTFLGVRGHQLSKTDLVATGLVTEELSQSPLLTPGSAGCAASHRMLWRACADGDKGFLILEDDCFTHPRISDYIDHNLAELMKYDIVFFGINTDSILESMSSQGLRNLCLFQPDYPDEEWINKALYHTDITSIILHRLFKAFGTCSYFVSPNGAALLDKLIFPLSLTTIEVPLINKNMPLFSIDRSGCAIYSRINAFVTIPFLAYSPNNDSSTK